MRMRTLWLFLLLCFSTAASAQVNININLSGFPDLVRVPNYPVYYAPRANLNYFFYDGLYWVYQNDHWHSSDWYNGPWYRVAPEYVPLYVLRVPVRYYRQPPGYFRGWRSDAPPRWGEHWGRDWEQNRSGWDRWNRRSAPAPAPLPTYQRQYSGNRYPRPEEQREIHDQKYRYQPRDALVREHVQPQVRQAAGAPPARERQPEQRRDAGKEARERQSEARKDYRQDERERDREQRSAPRPQAAPVPAVRERPPEAARREERPAPRTEVPSPRSQPQADPGREPSPGRRGPEREREKGKGD